MSTPTGRDAAVRRLREAARRGRSWARDYRYAVGRQAEVLFVRDVPAAFAEGALRPVVLLAGVLEPWSLLLPAARRLNAAGHPVHVVPELAYNRARIADAGRLVLAAVRARDLRDVVLVAHSKGGLVGKWMLAHDAEDRLARLVAIATPFHGSRLARLLPSRTIRALAPDDPAILELAARTDLNARITSIYPSFDPHIPDGSHLPGATNVPVAAMGHFQILSEPEVLDAVVIAAGS